MLDCATVDNQNDEILIIKYLTDNLNNEEYLLFKQKLKADIAFEKAVKLMRGALSVVDFALACK